MSGRESPAARSTSWSCSKKGTPSCSARRRPMADLPAPRMPTRATRAPRGTAGALEAPEEAAPSAVASTTDALVPSAFATSARRAMEMFPTPDSSSERNRSDTPQRSESARRERPRCSLAARTQAPTPARRASLERVAAVDRLALRGLALYCAKVARAIVSWHYTACESAPPGVPCAADGSQSRRPYREDTVRDPSGPLSTLDAHRRRKRRAPDHAGQAVPGPGRDHPAHKKPVR